MTKNRTPIKGTRDPGLFPSAIRSPGLTPEHPQIHPLAEELGKRLRVFKYKTNNPCLWIVFLGGTGTGKSTLFNALCGEELSRTGVERPKTLGPVAYAGQGCFPEEGFPLPNMALTKNDHHRSKNAPRTGEPGRLFIEGHNRGDLGHLVLVDTPDLDSLEEANRRSAMDLAFMADAIVFVASQEKYADEVPSQFLRKLLRDGKLVYFIINKTDALFDKNDLARVESLAEIRLDEERVLSVPRLPSVALSKTKAQPGFDRFQETLLEGFSADKIISRRKESLLKDAASLQTGMVRLRLLLDAEERACIEWLKQLNTLFLETSQEFIRIQGETFKAGARARIQNDIRMLFSRYDLLAGPRRAIGKAVRAPFRLLGLTLGENQRKKQAALQKARQATELTPLFEAVSRFNRRVLESLSPATENAPLFHAIRQPGVPMDRSEVEALVRAEQEKLEAWLKKRFDKMAQGLPRFKRWSIYSTSFVWGVLILTLEAVLGGGFTVLDALLDSALAPLVTKGSAELFAYQEIRKVAREMGESYREGLLSIIKEQHDRYERALQGLRTSREDLDSLDQILRDLSDHRFIEDRVDQGQASST